ncbi:MAG: dynamin family protein [Lachnospiraceae bacterium]|nr:dynamin family protein [Lachnospiraceae bacterium]
MRVNLEERVYYDTGKVMQDMEAALDRLKPFQYDSKYRELLGDHLIDKVSFWEKNIRRRREDPFTLVVCGEFKRGKSSLINAFLEEEVAPVNVTTETVTMNRISYGIHKNEAILSGGRRMTLRDEELSRSSLESIMEAVGEPIERLELQRPIELLKQITIIDTPGLQDSIRDFSNLVADALQQADAVIYVMSVSMPLSKSEMLYLKTGILPQKYTSLFLVSNFADMLSSEKDLSRVRDNMEKKLEGMLPGQKIWMVSALDEQCRQRQEERPCRMLQDILAEEFCRLRSSISNRISGKKEHVIPDRMQRMVGIMAADIGDDLTALEKGVEMSSQEAEETAAAVRRLSEQQAERLDEYCRRVDDRIRQMQNEASVWMGELIRRMQEETKDLDQYSVDQLSRYYPFFCIDTMQDAIRKCIDVHIDEIYEMLEEISSELGKKLSREYEKKNYNFRFAITGRTWTRGDSVGFMGSVMGNGLISLAADGIGGIMRKREIKDRKPELIQNIVRQYDALQLSVQRCMEEAYGQLGNKAKQLMTEYVNGQLLNSQAQADQSMAAARADQKKKEEIRQAVVQLKMVLENIAGGIHI